MANNRVWLVCRNHDESSDHVTRFLLAKHLMSGWYIYEDPPADQALREWLERHEECFFDRTGEVGWDHQFELEYED
jgi:hypothetical protein